MPITLKKDVWKVKDPSSGQYRGAAILSTTLPQDAAQIISESNDTIQNIKDTAIDAVDTALNDESTGLIPKAEADRDAIDDSLNNATNGIIPMAQSDRDDIDDSLNNINDGIIPEAQANLATIAAAVQSQIGQGTDKTLSVAKGFADAKAAGMLVKVSNYQPGSQLDDPATSQDASQNTGYPVYKDSNRVWVKETYAELEVPTMDDHNELKSALDRNELFQTQLVYPILKNCYRKNSTGMKVSFGAGWCTTEMVPLVPHMTFTLKNIKSGYGFYAVILFDKDRNFIRYRGKSKELIAESDQFIQETPESAFLAFNIWDGSSSTALTDEEISAWRCEISKSDIESLNTEVESLNTEIESTSISGFTNTRDLGGTVTAGKIYTSSLIDLANWSVLETEVTPGATCIVSGCGATAAPLYILFDTDGNKIFAYPNSPNTPQIYNDIPITIPENAATIIVNGHIYNSNLYVKEIVNGYDLDFSISGFHRDDISVGVTQKDSIIKFQYTDYMIIKLDGWEYKSVRCIPGKAYTVKGTAGPSVPLWVFYDSKFSVISAAKRPSAVQQQTDTIIAPMNAVLLFVNGQSGKTSIMTKSTDFVSDKEDEPEELVGIQQSGDIWEVGTGKMKTIVDLSGSQNGSFNFSTIQYNGENFKSAGDDIAPMNIASVGYVGANHGYNYVYKATLVGHGLTAADIGKTCVVNGNTWVLLKVDSTSVFTVACLDNDVWYGVKIQTPPSTFNFGKSITVASMSSVAQFHPSIRDKTVKIIENSTKAFIVAESYNVINFKAGIDAIIENVGNNDNNSVAERASSIMTVRNLYIFSPDSTCIIKQNLKMTSDQPSLSFYGGTQSIAFGSSDYFAVPETSNDSFTPTGNWVSFGRDTWTDGTKPPDIYLQIDDTESNATKMMLQGFVIDDRNSKISSSAGFVYTSRKMYPYGIQPTSTFNAGHTFDMISYRIPMYANEVSSDVRFVGYWQINSSWYLFCYNPTTVSAVINIPDALLGKTVETLISKNAKCLNKLTVTGVDVEITGSGYILMKLT